MPWGAQASRSTMRRRVILGSSRSSKGSQRPRGPNSSLAIVSRCCMRPPHRHCGHSGLWIQRSQPPTLVPGAVDSSAQYSESCRCCHRRTCWSNPPVRSEKPGSSAYGYSTTRSGCSTHASGTWSGPNHSSSNRGAGGADSGSVTSAARRQTATGRGPYQGASCSLGHHSSWNRSVCSGNGSSGTSRADSCSTPTSGEGTCGGW